MTIDNVTVTRIDLEDVGEPTRVDDVIADLHVHGETFLQALGRATQMPGVDPYDPALFAAVRGGHMPVKGRNVPLPRLDAAGVAAICRFELDSANYTAARALTYEPSIPPEPRIPVRFLWPHLRKNGCRVGGDHDRCAGRRARTGNTPRSVLAELSGLPLRLIDRICSGSQQTASVTQVIAILEAVGADELAGKLDEDILQAWDARRSAAYYDRLEYIDALARFALIAAGEPDLTDDERTAIKDILWLSREAQRIPDPSDFLLSAEERLLEAETRFRHEHHGRDALTFPPRLRRRAHAMLRHERQLAHDRAQQLRAGIHRKGNLSAAAVTQRVFRLRRSNQLRQTSRPRPYPPAADTGAMSDT